MFVGALKASTTRDLELLMKFKDPFKFMSVKILFYNNRLYCCIIQHISPFVGNLEAVETRT
jgi:hypothetical protein